MVKYLTSNIRPIRYITSFVSIALMVVSLISFAMNGLNMGLDFTGGMVTEVQVDDTVTHNQLLEQLQPTLGEFTTVTHSDEEGRWVIRYQFRSRAQM